MYLQKAAFLGAGYAIFLLLGVCVVSVVGGGPRLEHGRIEHVSEQDLLPRHNRCEPITITLCNNIQYNTTIMPNMLGHHSQEEAGMEVHQFFPLVKVHCSPELHFFLCSVYVPVCTIMDRPLPPCRPLCLSAKHGCEDLMNKFGFQWPDSLDCNKFPLVSTDDELCVGKNVSSPRPGGSMGSIGGMGPSQDNPYFPGLVSGGGNGHGSLVPTNNQEGSLDLGLGMDFQCPLHFKVPTKYRYHFKVGKAVASDCGAPCQGMFFDKDQLKFSREWVGGWAGVCLLSTSFTVASFLVDVRRFRYPERPIIFISMCYWFIAAVYVVGLWQGDNISCDAPWDPPQAVPDLQGAMVSTITQGVDRELCTIVFMTLYFFTMAASLWWVVLTATWFLAAGLKWSHEAIENHSAWFHVVAWAIPAIKTIVVLGTEKVEGT